MSVEVLDLSPTNITINESDDCPIIIVSETAVTQGPDGKSAYEVAVENGFVGNEAAWLASLVGDTGATGAQGATGATGATGANGSSAYVYIAYASDASGTGFTTTFNAALDYIAVKTTTTSIASPAVGDFTGLWKNYKGATGSTGATGANGTNGTNGTDGTNAYVYIAYASDDSGTGFTTTFDPLLNYIAIKSTTILIASPSVGDFTGLWKNYGSGNGGGQIVATSSYASPSSISTSISIPTDIRARVYLVGSGGPVVDPTLGTGSTGQELFLFGTSDTNTVELNDASNLKLSGPIVIKDTTEICLHWIDGLNKWVEASRNEI